jgi:hypothetical protein
MRLFEQYKILTEKKDHLIKKLVNLSDEEKQELIDFFNKKPNLENKIDWQNKNLKFDDFKLLMQQYSEKKIEHLKLVRGEDYIPLVLNGNKAYIPLNYEASVEIASDNVGSCQGKWCTANSEIKTYWNDYVEQKEIILIYVIYKKTKYAIACSLKLLNMGEQWLEIFDEFDNHYRNEKNKYPAHQSMTIKELTDETGITEQDILKHKDLLIKANEIIQSGISIYDKYEIKNYTINSDGTCDVQGSVFFNQISHFGSTVSDLTQFNFRNIYGDFSVRNCGLESLEGAPEYVHGTFDCSFNKLTGLKGCPKIVEEGDFLCQSNQLTSLKYSPKKINGSYICSGNQLTDLKGAPEYIDGMFDCVKNKLKTLKDMPKEIRSNCYYMPQFGGFNPSAEEIDEYIPFSRRDEELLEFKYKSGKSIQWIAQEVFISRSEKTLIKKLKEMGMLRKNDNLEESNVIDIYKEML